MQYWRVIRDTLNLIYQTGHIRVFASHGTHRAMPSHYLSPVEALPQPPINLILVIPSCLNHDKS
jgi:hypothetical protein